MFLNTYKISKKVKIPLKTPIKLNNSKSINSNNNSIISTTVTATTDTKFQIKCHQYIQKGQNSLKNTYTNKQQQEDQQQQQQHYLNINILFHFVFLKMSFFLFQISLVYSCVWNISTC